MVYLLKFNWCEQKRTFCLFKTKFKVKNCLLEIGASNLKGPLLKFQYYNAETIWFFPSCCCTRFSCIQPIKLHSLALWMVDHICIGKIGKPEELLGAGAALWLVEIAVEGWNFCCFSQLHSQNLHTLIAAYSIAYHVKLATTQHKTNFIFPRPHPQRLRSFK